MERRFVYDWATIGQNYITTKWALNTNMGRFLKLVNMTSGLHSLQPLNFYPGKSDFVQDGTVIDRLELLGVGLAGDSTLRMAYLCYHLPRHLTPDLVGWKDLIWAGREQRDRCRPALWGAFLEDRTAAVCTTFVQRCAV